MIVSSSGLKMVIYTFHPFKGALCGHTPKLHVLYVEPMKTFLNSFMNRNRKLTVHKKGHLTKLFTNTVDAASRFENAKPFRLERVLLASLFDAGMIGLAKRLEKGQITDVKAAYDRYLDLVSDPAYYKLLTRATANERNVKDRINGMVNALKDVP